MDKENLQTKLEALEANVQAKQNELGVAMSEAQMAREELANAGKPKLSQDTLVVLVEKLQDVFQDALNDFDTTDLDVEFGIGYDNRIELENVDMSTIEVHSCDIETVLEEIFCIVVDEESDNS